MLSQTIVRIVIQIVKLASCIQQIAKVVNRLWYEIHTEVDVLLQLIAG